MSLLILVIGITWGLCGAWGYRLAKNWWLRYHDYKRSDRTFFLALTVLGPAFLGGMSLILATDWISKRERGQEILERRR